jgi:hypothetical protein
MDDARTHLERLAQELRQRQWTARLGRRGSAPILTVVNPGAPRITETVICSGSAGDYVFCWSWRQTIGPVGEVSGAADRIQHVLRGVES